MVSVVQMRKALICSVLLLAACTTPEEKRRDAYVGQDKEQDIYEYTVEHWPTAFWSETKLEAWIKRDATQLCPQGYREVSRTPVGSHVTYTTPIPTPYTEIKVRISCPKVAS